MATTTLLPDDMIELLKQRPGQPNEHLIQERDLNLSFPTSSFPSLLARANLAVDLETRKWVSSKRKRKHLPGETNGSFDNVIRALENNSVG